MVRPCGLSKKRTDIIHALCWCVPGGYDCGTGSPCTEANRELEQYYFAHANARLYVQCDDHEGCWVRRCPPGTEFDESIFVCDVIHR